MPGNKYLKINLNNGCEVIVCIVAACFKHKKLPYLKLKKKKMTVLMTKIWMLFTIKNYNFWFPWEKILINQVKIYELKFTRK